MAGFALYGGALSEFRSIFSSLLYLLRVVLLDYDYSRMYNHDPAVSAVFFVSYLLIFKLGMLNMFVAIIVAHYN